MKEYPQVLIVEASAGSGKTYCLAKQYLKLLLNKDSHPQQIKEILAITFTNKASREMKERILEFLKKIALDEFSDPKQEKDILSSLPISKQEARIKAAALMDYIIAHYNFFQVKTIDSFINMILLGCAYQIGLSANFKIRDDRENYLTLSLDDCIEQANHDKAVEKIFRNFLDQYIYLEGKNSWLPKLDIANLISAMLYHANIYGGNFKKFELKGKSLYQEKQLLLQLFKKVADKAPQGINGTFLKTLSRFVQENEEIFDFGDIAGKANLMKDELPMNKGEVAPAELNRLWKKIRQECAQLAEKEASSFFNCYIDIFNLVYESFRKYAKKDDVLFLEELNQQAHTLIQQNGVTVPELYYHIATRLRHFLIDEFQDTSTLQWRNLCLMIDDIIATGGSLFYVGDKKQAIFRFRGGEVTLFDKLKNNFKAYAKPDFLNTNYRSVKEIVKFNNAVFSQENLRRFLIEQQEALNKPLKTFDEEDIKEILGVYSSPKQENKDEKKPEAGLVKVEPVAAKTPGERDRIIKAKLFILINEITARGRFAQKDITVLCRGNKEIELVSSWLIEKHIPVESEKTLNIKNNKFIKELISLLCFLNSPVDNLSFASFILGEIFLKAAGLKKEEIEDFLFGLKEKLKNEEGFYIYREFKRKYAEIWGNFIEDFFRAIGFIGLYELTIDIYQRFGVFVNFTQQQGFFMHFLQLIKDSEDEYPGITDFLEHLEEIDDAKLFVNSSGANAIKVLTIHKAKGLGFNVVIIPFLYLDINDLGSQAKKRRVSYVVEEEEAETGLSLLRLDQKYALLSDRILKAWRHEYKKAFIDELNTIYVALTRAKFELYIFIPHGVRMINNIASLLIPQDYFQVGSPQPQVEEPEEEAPSLLIPAPQYQDWITFLKEEFADESAVRNRKSILRGEILHEILAAVGNLTKADKEEAIKEGFSLAANAFPAAFDFSEFDPIIRRVLEAENLRQFFFVPDGEVFQEKEIVDSFGITKRIDRLIIKEKEAWIVDYKSKEELGLNYREQIQTYKAVIKALYPERTVKGFLIYLEELKAEEVDG